MTLRPATGPIPKTVSRPKERKRLKPVSKKRRARWSRERAAFEAPIPHPIPGMALGVLGDVVPLVGASSLRKKQAPPIEKATRLRSRTWLELVKGERFCEADEDCPDPPVDPHHVKTRGRRDDTFDITAIPLCRKHHDDAHDGRIAVDELYRMLGAFLCRRLPLLARSEARRVLEEMLAGLNQ